MRRADVRRFGPAALAAALLVAASAHGSPPPLSPDLAPLAFLVGSWVGDSGHAEGSQTARGRFTIEPAAGGRALLRQDHTQVLARDGHVAQTIEQIMLVYPDAGRLHGDYFDGRHAIHYVDSEIESGRRARFITSADAGAAAFRLTYTKLGDGHLSIQFEMRPTDQTTFQTIAEGTAHSGADAR